MREVEAGGVEGDVVEERGGGTQYGCAWGGAL